MLHDPPSHLQHPAMSAHTLCGYIAGEGCLFAGRGEIVTCPHCRAVVAWARDVYIGYLRGKS